MPLFAAAAAGSAAAPSVRRPDPKQCCCGYRERLIFKRPVILIISFNDPSRGTRAAAGGAGALNMPDTREIARCAATPPQCARRMMDNPNIAHRARPPAPTRARRTWPVPRRCIALEELCAGLASMHPRRAVAPGVTQISQMMQTVIICHWLHERAPCYLDFVCGFGIPTHKSRPPRAKRSGPGLSTWLIALPVSACAGCPDLSAPALDDENRTLACKFLRGRLHSPCHVHAGAPK